MKKYQEIIAKGKITTADLGLTFDTWISYSVLLAMSILAIIVFNTDNKKTVDYPNQPLLFNFVFIVLSIFAAWCLFLTGKKLRTRFYKDNRSLEKKKQVIEHLKEVNHWRLKKEDTQYFLFLENNIIITSYYITIVYDETGFYLNCFPWRGRVFDFGKSYRWCDELFDDMK